MQLSRYLKTYPCPDDPERLLLLATRRCAVLEVSTSLWQRIASGDELPAQERETLIELGVLVADRQAEREEMLATFHSINAASRQVSVTATLTLECNLACPYCYEDPFRGSLVMSPDTADLLVQRLSERMAQGMDVSVDFYGGEALLRRELLMDIARRLGENATTEGVKFSFNLFTNGLLLTEPTVRKLLPLGLSAVRLTLDGPADVHDAQRPRVSGRGSFDAILANLVEVHRLVPVDLGGNYTRHNYHRFPELLDLMIAAGVQPELMKEVSFSPVMPRADGSVAGDRGSACACTSEPWAIFAALFLREEVMQRGFPVKKLAPGACMIEFANDLVVGYDGSFYKCPVFMGRQELRVGSLADGIGDYRESHNLDVWKNDTCLDCPYLPLCFGGCRFFRSLKTGAIDGVDCRREMFDASLELLVRQDEALCVDALMR